MRYFQGTPKIEGSGRRQLPHSPHPISATDSTVFCKNTKILRHTLIPFTAHTLGNPGLRRFSRSSVKTEKFRELVNFSKSDVIAFRPLLDVRWLSRHLAATAFLRSYNILIENCTEQINTCNDPINKYSLQRLLNRQF